MANVILSELARVVIEVGGVQITFIQKRGGPAPVEWKGQPGNRAEDVKETITPGQLKTARELARREFVKHNEAENLGFWREPAPIAECVSLEVLGKLAGGSVKFAQPQAVQLELFPQPKEYFGVYGRED